MGDQIPQLVAQERMEAVVNRPADQAPVVSPFALDKLIDAKSGYDHMLFQKLSQQCFGFQWSG